MVAIRPANNNIRRALLGLGLGLASLGIGAHGAVVMAGNPFIRTDRALQRLTRMLDEMVVASNLPPQVQPLWRRVVQQPPSTTDMDQPQPALAPDASLLSFRAEAIETPDSYVIQVDLPGVKRNAVRIAFHESNVLGITATRSNPHEAAAAAGTNGAAAADKDSGKGPQGTSNANELEASSAAASAGAHAFPKYLMREVAYGSVTRKLKLPSDANPETAVARFEDGVLTIEVKKREMPKEKVIPIQ